MIEITLGHWHPKHTRTIAGMANGQGGTLRLGLGAETPNGFRHPDQVINKIQSDLAQHLNRIPKLCFSKHPRAGHYYFVQLEIEPIDAQNGFCQRHGVCWIRLGEQFFKCQEQVLIDFWKQYPRQIPNAENVFANFHENATQNHSLLETEQFQVLRTSDGSTTLYRKDIDETYHSKHGSRRESEHVFIENGLKYFTPNHGQLNILEVGLGTGLNCILTLFHQKNHRIHYDALEPIPIPPEVHPLVRTSFGKDLEDFFTLVHQSSWNQANELSSDFTLHKHLSKLEDFSPTTHGYDLIYFDAFAPNKQPELWQESLFQKLYAWTNPNGILVSYCSQGAFQRALQSAGYRVECIPGPPGKREMVRAIKAIS